MFYLSEYLEVNRDEYYQRLSAISQHGDWTGWIKFFLGAITQQARKNVSQVKAIMNLYEATKVQVRDITRSQHTAQLVDTLFDRPIFRVSDVVQRSGINKQTLHGLLRQLQQPEGPLTILREGIGRRPAIYAFPALLNICEGKTVLPATAV